MDRKQMTGDPLTALLAALDGRQAVMWTALPATIISFDPVLRTVSAQVTVKAQATNRDGSTTWVQLPPLLDCPVFFPGGRGLSLTFPLQAGDEVLVIFASRCIDLWFARSGIQEQAELRMHDLSDGFCFPAVLSAPQAAARAPVSLDAAELRNAAGTTKIRLLNTGAVEVVTPGAVEVTAGSATVTASSVVVAATSIALNGVVSIAGELIINGQTYEDHAHTGVSDGTDISGGVA